MLTPHVRVRGYYLGITTDQNYQLAELPAINVGNSNVGNSEVLDRNFHSLIRYCVEISKLFLTNAT